MKPTAKDELLSQLAQYGYELMQPRSVEPGEKVLESLLRQDDSRLLEGFPVVLAHLLREKEALSWEDKNWHPHDELSKKTEYRLAFMLVLSYLQFLLFQMDDEASRTFKLVHKFEDGKRLLNQLRERVGLEKVQMDKVELSNERLKRNFVNYVVHANKHEDVEKKRHVLELELLLSELFTSRQKELVNMRLQNKPMTKTEKEYFYRVVKKRLKALANEELHHFARDLVLK